MHERSHEAPTREMLSAKYGFRVPEAFVTVVRVAFEACREHDEPFQAFYEDIGSLCLGRDCRYPQTPPELFPIGSMGVDGVHYGYVLHAPELPRDEYPIGQLCPMDDDGVILVGRNTPTAFENLISTNLSYRLEREARTAPERQRLEDVRQRIALVSAALDISPHPAKSAHRYGPDGAGLPVTPEVPDGWLHVPTADGIGVLAPRAAFQPGEPSQLEPYGDPTGCLTSGQEALDVGFPATALLHFREGFWYHWTDTDLRIRFVKGMIDCFHTLGRPALAAMIERTTQANHN